MNTTTTATESHCLRCGRKLTASTSYGPTCARKIREAALGKVREDFTTDQQAKALELITDGGIVPHTRKGVYQAVSSKGDTVYLTHASACNCPAGLRAKRPCYHTLAARLLGLASRRSITSRASRATHTKAA